MLNTAVADVLSKGDSIESVALGADHTVVLSSSGAVVTFGRGEHGQLGHGPEKPFVAAARKSKFLSNERAKYACAVFDCSFTLDASSRIIASAGKCGELGEVTTAACVERHKRAFSSTAPS